MKKNDLVLQIHYPPCIPIHPHAKTNSPHPPLPCIQSYVNVPWSIGNTN
ncbi:MAG: hypothetical protein ACI8WB_001543 [Phenylobacterium sp.]|jgi:hypothetical protein